MSRKRKTTTRRLQGSLVFMGLVAGTVQVSGQVADLEQPPTWEPPHLKYIKTDVELNQTTYESAHSSTDSQRLYLNSGLGIGWSRFVYHPDLFMFSMVAEPGYNWQQYDSGGASSSSEAVMLNGDFTGTLLRAKPYATTLNYGRSHDNYQYDVFNSSTMDVERWGVNTGYREGPVPVTMSLQRSQSEANGLNYNSTSEQTTLNLTAKSSRGPRNYTDLSYQYNTYDGLTQSAGSSLGAYQSSSSSHNLSVNDTEIFGKHSLNSTLYFNHVEMQNIPSDSLNLALDYGYDITPKLRSYCDYAFGYNESGGDSATSHSVSAGLQHQLYESLSSGMSVHSLNSSSEGSGSQMNSQTLGGVASLSYNKRLGEWGNLSLSDVASYDLTQQTIAGLLQPVLNESHPVSAITTWFYLSQPRVILPLLAGSITYLDGGAPVPLTEGVDFAPPIPGTLTQIQMLPSGLTKLAMATPAATSVQVNYFVEPNPTGDYRTINNISSVRLDFWHQRAGIYASYGFSDNQASDPDFVLNNFTDIQLGGDLNWNQLRLDAQLTDRQSSLYNYQSINFTESYMLLATYEHSLRFDMHQMQAQSDTTGSASVATKQTYYNFTCNYNWKPLSNLSWNIQAGLQHQEGSYNQDSLVLHSRLSWGVGKLSFQLGYDYEQQQYATETQVRNYGYLRMRRSF